MTLRAVQGGRHEATGRVPPHNLVAEVQVLAHALSNPRDVAVAAGMGLEPQHFHDPANSRIWEATLAVHGSVDTVVTFATVHDWLRARGWIEKAGGEPYLRRLAHETALEGPTRTYARMVLTLARLRAAQAEAHLLANEPYGDVGDPDEWLEAAPQRLARHTGAGRARGVQSFAETLKTSWQQLNAAPGTRAGYATKLEAFDAATGGLHPGEVLLISAKEKAGKSMLVGQWLAAMADGHYPVHEDDGQPALDRRGKPITRRRAGLIFALDSAKKTDWAERVASASVMVDLERFRIGTANERDRTALARGVEYANKLPVFVDGKEITSIGQLGARIRGLRDELAAEGTDLVAVAIDYIQLAKGDGQKPEERISSAMRGVVALAGQEDLKSIAWVVISQTNSEGDLSHCRALAQMCDSWVHLSVDDDKPSDAWWSETAQGGETVTSYPARLAINRARRGAMGRRAQPIALWACYRFTFFYSPHGGQ